MVTGGMKDADRSGGGSEDEERRPSVNTETHHTGDIREDNGCGGRTCQESGKEEGRGSELRDGEHPGGEGPVPVCRYAGE